MNITVIHVGDLKEKYYRDAVEEYEKRISRFCRIKSVEIKEERLPDDPSEKQIGSALAAEGKSRGLSKLCLEVRASNAAALSLYEKNGFYRVGIRRGYYTAPKEDAVLLDKDL